VRSVDEYERLEPIDPWTSVFYKPRTMVFLCIGFAILIYYSGALVEQDIPHTMEKLGELRYKNYKNGILGACCAFLLYSTVQGPKAKMIRPHPAVWRFVHGLMVLYLVFLVFLAFQTVHDARQFLKHLSPDLGVEPSERNYAEDCRIYMPEKDNKFHGILSTIFDPFVLAHSLGWFGRALIYRDYAMLWTMSILFELSEITFKHMLPNFAECWWDSWVLDVLLCNNLGIIAGMQAVKYFATKKYNWRGMSATPGVYDKAKRALFQFTPASFEWYIWGLTSSPRRFISCTVLILFDLAFALNSFFLKYELWIEPPSCYLNSARLVLLFSMAVPSVRDYHEFLDRDDEAGLEKLGSFAWLSSGILFAETLICYKFGRGLFPKPAPPIVFWAWTSSGIALAVYWMVWYLRDRGIQVDQKAKST